MKPLTLINYFHASYGPSAVINSELSLFSIGSIPIYTLGGPSHPTSRARVTR